ncbi:large conductance mechanosensitive channel protein MscL [Candidatus Saccharibacteria bacterium]|jgi:large conductance mechanosensitive channel protein|nr:large conductance mechanosensitive channel protein MscL [Candidatus Saccharibacteria bacterium]
MLNEFKKFILRGNVVDLAVGIVVGSAFTGVVNAFVKDIINPLVPTGSGQSEFARRYFMIHHSKFLYGDLVINILSFLIVAGVVFFLVVQPINKLSEIAMRSKDTPEETTTKCPHCLSKVPKGATKCMYCTSKLEAEKA